MGNPKYCIVGYSIDVYFIFQFIHNNKTAVSMTGGERVALPIGAMSATNPRSVQIVSASSGLYVRSCRSVTTVNRPLNLA